MSRIEELKAIIKSLKEENEQLRKKIFTMKDEARPRCSGCGDILDGPHHSFCGEREFG